MVLLSSDLSIFMCGLQPIAVRGMSVLWKEKVTDVCECKEVLWKQRWGAVLSIAL